MQAPPKWPCIGDLEVHRIHAVVDHDQIGPARGAAVAPGRKGIPRSATRVAWASLALSPGIATTSPSP